MALLELVILQGLFSARPTDNSLTPSTVGRLFYATDTHALYRDNGTTWDTWALGGVGDTLRFFEGEDVTITVPAMGNDRIVWASPRKNVGSLWNIGQAVRLQAAEDGLYEYFVSLRVVLSTPLTSGEYVAVEVPSNNGLNGESLWSVSDAEAGAGLTFWINLSGSLYLPAADYVTILCSNGSANDVDFVTTAVTWRMTRAGVVP